MKQSCYIVPNPTGPTLAVSIHTQRCIGCNSCANVCRTQTLLPNPVRRQPPVVAYPDECWYCACCVEACPTGALEMHLPINQRIFFKRKESGEIFRIGADDCPPKSYFKPPIGSFGVQRHEDVWKMLLRRNRKPAAVWIAVEACRQIAEHFGETDDPAADGRTAAMLRLIGFDAVYQRDTALPAAEFAAALRGTNPELQIVAVLPDGIAESAGGIDADAILSAREVVKMWGEACVSAFTAVTVRKTLPEECFD